MSVSVYVAGVRDPDGKLGDMVSLKQHCDKLQIVYPPELREYFKGTEALEYDEEDEVIREATEVDLKWGLCIEGLLDGDVEYGDGMVIDLAKLPDDIKKLRISMS